MNYLAGAVPEGPVIGRLYELQTAANILTQSPGATVTFVSKFSKEIDPLTGKALSRTDIDFIIESAGETIYYQAKSSAKAFGDSVSKSITKAKAWVEMARKDAEGSGVPNAVIRYLTPNPGSVNPKIAEALNGLGVLIEPSPLLH